jgi:hypothetical protein
VSHALDNPDRRGPDRPGSERVRPDLPDKDVGNPDWSPWVLLLIIPVVLPLLTFIYNRVHPMLFGMPSFYWIQLAFVPMSAVCTGLVYLMTRKKGDWR